MMAHYGISYSTVSQIFVGSSIGYVAASLANVPLTRAFGMGRVIVAGAAINGVGALTIVMGFAPFDTMVIAYGICGFGLAIQDAQLNTYIARLPDAPRLLGISHALYSVSGMLAPVLATLVLGGTSLPFRFFYLSNFAWAVLGVSTLVAGFGDSIFSTAGSRSVPGPTESQSEEETARLEEHEEHAPLLQVVRSRAVWATLLWVFAYVGSEIGEAGWIVTYLREERGASVSAGYGTSAFFGGLTIGRVALLPITERLREKLAVGVYILCALAMQVVVHFVRSYRVDIAAVFLFGCTMGPMYPVALALMVRTTPPDYHTGAVGLMACLGQVGSAIFPAIVGALAEAQGVKVLLPVQFGLLAAMFAVWSLIPSHSPALK